MEGDRVRPRPFGISANTSSGATTGRRANHPGKEVTCWTSETPQGASCLQATGERFSIIN